MRNDASESTKRTWILQTKKCIKNAMLADHDTIFDAFLFGDQIGFVICRTTVKFPELKDENLKTIRAVRLKMLGYKWDGVKKEWYIEDKDINQYG